MEAGLPNITGAGGLVVDGRIEGAMYYVKSGTRATGESKPYYQLYFDASRCSSIYGNSESVNPTSLTTGWFIKF